MKLGRPPSLLLSGLLTLVPVFALAVAGLRSLQLDQADVESAAHRELTSLSVRFASEVAAGWKALTPTAEETLVLNPISALPPEAPQRSTTWRFNAAGESVDVFFAPEIPVAPTWWSVLSPDQRASYREFVANLAANERDVPPSDWPESARLSAEFERHRARGISTNRIADDRGRQWTEAWGILLPSGLSLDEAALWRELSLEVTVANLAPRLSQVREYLEREQPGSWMELDSRLAEWERLFPQFHRAASGSPNSLRDLPTVAAVRQFGAFRATEREKIREFQHQHPVAGWRPSLRPWQRKGHSFCSIIQALSTGATNETTLNRSAKWAVTHVPIKILHDAVWSALHKLSSETPPYACPQFRWANPAWSLDAPWPQPSTNQTFGNLRPVSWGTLVGADAVAEVGFDVADTRLLLSGQRRRAATLGGLVVGAALISALGFWQLRRAFWRQAQLAEQQSNFVASVSHELRAPVANLGLLVENLRCGDITEWTRREEYLRLIGREYRRLAQLIQNVLATGRLDQGRREYVKEPFDLRRMVEETVAGFAPLAREHSVGMEISVIDPPSGRTFEAIGDSLAWQQAVTNLLDNALKHSPPAATVRVALAWVDTNARDGSHNSILRLTIDDSGPGVPAADRERIFERFYRRGSELRRETEGIGLGLTLVRHTLEAHGGRVWCEANPEGVGSRFIVESPTASC